GAVGILLHHLRLAFGVEGEVDELKRDLLVLRSLDEAPVVGAQLALVVVHVDRCARALRGDAARTDGACDVGLARGQQLDRFRVTLVPLAHEWPQTVYALPRTLDVDGIEPVDRHAVGEQRDLELGRDAAAEVERSSPFELLTIPDLHPRARML